MRKVAKIVLGATAALVFGAGAAHAASAEFHTMNVTLPNGAVAKILYAGDIAPKVEIAATDAAATAGFDPGFMQMSAFPMFDSFARMDRISAMMNRQMQAMMQQAAQLRQNAAGLASGAPGLVMVGNLPAGAHVSYVSTSSDANGCTRTVSYSSDGTANAAPKLIRTASAGCDTAAGHNAAAIPAKAEAPQPATPAPGHTI